MGRPRNGRPKRRYSTTIDAELANRWDAHAGRRATGAAARLLERAMEQAMNEGTGAEAEPADEAPRPVDAHRLAAIEHRVEEIERRIEDLTVRVVKAQRSHERSSNAATGGDVASLEAGIPAVRDGASRPRRGPRWEWPVTDLLADAEWWDTWLPRLYELLGHEFQQDLHGGRMANDERGYVDLLALLFPAIDGVTWRSPAYGTVALAAGRPDQARMPGRSLRRGHAWLPVIRHVAEALCALESTGAEGGDAYLRLRAKAEIVGPWSDVLARLLGEGTLRRPQELG